MGILSSIYGLHPNDAEVSKLAPACSSDLAKAGQKSTGDDPQSSVCAGPQKPDNLKSFGCQCWHELQIRFFVFKIHPFPGGSEGQVGKHLPAPESRNS